MSWITLPRDMPVFWAHAGEETILHETISFRAEGEIVFVGSLESKRSENDWHLGIPIIGASRGHYLLLECLDEDMRTESFGWAHEQMRAVDAALSTEQIAGRMKAHQLRKSIEKQFREKYCSQMRVVA